MKNIKGNILNLIGNNIIFPFWRVLHSTEADALYANNNLRGTHKGERCFVLGNGPSLKNDDLSGLGNEFVFTVNQFARSSSAEIVKSNCHFWADRLLLSDDGSAAAKELISTMIRIGDYNSELISFFPIDCMEFVKSHDIDKYIKVKYYYSPLSMELGNIRKIDYTRFTPGFGTVVQWCITMAIYMGFSEIYLLGCDNTALMTIIKSALKTNDENDYAYNYSKTEKKRMEDMVDNQSFEVFVRAYLNNVVEYRLLSDFCKKMSVKLINCSSATVIDSIPRMPLSDVL